MTTFSEMAAIGIIWILTAIGGFFTVRGIRRRKKQNKPNKQAKT